MSTVIQLTINVRLKEVRLRITILCFLRDIASCSLKNLGFVRLRKFF